MGSENLDELLDMATSNTKKEKGILEKLASVARKKDSSVIVNRFEDDNTWGITPESVPEFVY